MKNKLLASILTACMLLMMRGDLITIEAVKLPMFPAVKSWKLR